MSDSDPPVAGQAAGGSDSPEADRLRYAAIVLAETPTAMETLLRGEPVPRDQLRPRALHALGEPLLGPEFTLDYAKALRIELVTSNGRLDQEAEHGQVGLTLQTIAEFAAIDEASAEPILGTEDSCVLSIGGMMVLYGDGGAGKTTMELDQICHLASGTGWCGLPVHGRSRILVIENEGPRGMFRKKTRRKLETWRGKEIGDYVHVLEDPWALFSFGEEAYREQLLALIQQHAFDIVAAGPVNRLGMEGGGTPDEVGAFILNIELIRQRLERPVAVIFAHHENKAGDVSGAWEGVPDTLAHVQASGNGHTRLFWQKVRWGPELHGKTWMLNWGDGESFKLQETVELSDAEIEQAILAYVRDNPGCSWNEVEATIEVQAARKRRARDQLLKNDSLENAGSKRQYHLRLVENPQLSVDSDSDIPF